MPHGNTIILKFCMTSFASFLHMRSRFWVWVFFLGIMWKTLASTVFSRLILVSCAALSLLYNIYFHIPTERKMFPNTRIGIYEIVFFLYTKYAIIETV